MNWDKNPSCLWASWRTDEGAEAECGMRRCRGGETAQQTNKHTCLTVPVQQQSGHQAGWHQSRAGVHSLAAEDMSHNSHMGHAGFQHNYLKSLHSAGDVRPWTYKTWGAGWLRRRGLSPDESGLGVQPRDVRRAGATTSSSDQTHSWFFWERWGNEDGSFQDSDLKIRQICKLLSAAGKRLGWCMLKNIKSKKTGRQKWDLSPQSGILIETSSLRPRSGPTTTSQLFALARDENEPLNENL